MIEVRIVIQSLETKTARANHKQTKKYETKLIRSHDQRITLVTFLIDVSQVLSN